jgi:hypothetical protein
MADQDRADIPGTSAEAGAEPFRNIARLRNHWSRSASPRAYYWYLAFADAPELHALAARCQQAIAFPYYDPVPPESLHLTLDRIAFEDGITPAELDATAAAAQRACQAIPPFAITVGPLGGTRGAVGLTAAPARPVRDLRDALRAATLSACRAAPVTPHERRSRTSRSPTPTATARPQRKPSRLSSSATPPRPEPRPPSGKPPWSCSNGAHTPTPGGQSRGYHSPEPVISHGSSLSGSSDTNAPP